MGEAVSRAGWHAKHLRHGASVPGQAPSANTRGDRRRLLKEAMRALEESDAARQAARNPSIVAADTHLNRAYVNDGMGGFRELTPEEGVEPVLEHGDKRIDAVKRKWHEKSFETTTIVSWVPKSLLREVPNYYPVMDFRVDPDTGKQVLAEVGRRSRWVMPDDAAGQAEVQRWFDETHAHLCEDVFTGGHDAIDGAVWNYDESAVHVHFMGTTTAALHKDMSVGPDMAMLDAAGEPIVKYKKSVTLDTVVPLAKDLDGELVVAAAPEIRVDAIGGIDKHGYLTDADGVRFTRADGTAVLASTDLRVEAQQMWGQSSEVTETRVVDGVETQVKITGSTKMSRYQERYRERLVEAGFDIELEVNPQGTSLDKKAYGASEAERMAVESAAVALEAERAEVAVERAEVDAERKQAFQSGYGEGLRQGRTDAEAQAATIVADARTEATRITDDATAAVRDAVRLQRERLEREETEARAAADARVREYEKAERAKIPPYDPERANEAMTAAKLDTMRKLKGAPRKDKTPRTVDEWVDEKTAEVYAHQGRPVPTETMGERTARGDKVFAESARERKRLDGMASAVERDGRQDRGLSR